MTERHGGGRRGGWSSAATAWRRVALGRRLRVLAGVDERLLDKAPLERTRYSGLGGVVLGTAVVAGLSMWFALSQILGGGHPLLLVPVVAWALIVLNLDRWLVSAATGIWQRKVLMLVPRLLVAVLLGMVIAEPLVLRVFETAVEQHVKDGREDAREVVRTRMAECNPWPPTAQGRQDCDGSRLPAVGAAADLSAIRRLEADSAKLQEKITAARRRHEKLSDLANDECAGKEGAGLSGKRGKGPLCMRLEAQAAPFRAEIRENETRLRELGDQIAGLSAPLIQKEADFGARLQRAIDDRLDDLPTKDDPIGLLERLKALHELIADNPYLFTASWLIRLFLIMIDCLPVLVKLMGGTTAYDRMAGLEIRERERVHAMEAELRAKEEMEEFDLAAYGRAEERRKRRQNIDVARRAAEAQARSRLEDLVDRRAEALRRAAHEERRNGTPPRPFEASLR